jgi:hypothetical protein
MPRWNVDYSSQGHYPYASLRIYPFLIRRHEGSRTTNDRNEDRLARSILEARVDDGMPWIIAQPCEEAKKKGDASRAQINPAASQPRNLEEEKVNDDDEVELRFPGSFGFEDVGRGAAQLRAVRVPSMR